MASDRPALQEPTSPQANCQAQRTSGLGENCRLRHTGEFVHFQQVIEICVEKTLAAKEVTSYDHYGMGEKEVCAKM